MIELVSELLEENIKFIEGRVNILEVNNKELYNRIIYRLNKKINIDEDYEDIYLYEDNKEISVGKNCMLIYDLFNVFNNQTKIFKSLFDDIVKEYKFNYDEIEILSLQKELIDSIKEIILEYDYELNYKEVIDIKDLLKVLDVRFDNNHYDNPFENILLLIDLITNFKICKVLILINSKCLFSKDELEEIYKMILYKRINVLFVEVYKGDVDKKYENKVLIDEDFDEFYL